MSFEKIAQLLGDRIRALRKRHGLTQEQAAVLSGTEYKYYQAIENGKKNLRLDTIERIARAFGLDGWDLFRDVLPEHSKIGKVPKPAPHRPRRPRGRPKKSPE